MAGFIDQVAIRKDLVDSTVQLKRSHDVPYVTMWSDDDAYIHPTSVVYGMQPAPEMVIYGELVRTSKVWLQGKYTTHIIIHFDLIYAVRTHTYRCNCC
jgi:ATP-dependent RNA helicase DHX37/DHR1